MDLEKSLVEITLYQRHFENIINHLKRLSSKTIIKLSYGYHYLEHFRKQAMMIVAYRKDLENSPRSFRVLLN